MEFEAHAMLTYPGKTINIAIGDANEGVQRLARRFQASPNARGVAFLDPYGPNLHWRTVDALARTGKVDVILNFPLAMAINRLIKRDQNIRESWAWMLDECFGTHDWFDLSYEAMPTDFSERPVFGRAKQLPIDCSLCITTA